MRKQFKLQNTEQIIEASLLLDDRRKQAFINFQVMKIEDKGEYITRTFTIFEDPSKRYLLLPFTRKTKKQLEAIDKEFEKELPEYLSLFTQQFNLVLQNESN